MPRLIKRIFVLVHFPDDSEQMVGPFSSIEEAVDQQSSYSKGMHYDVEFSYCGELCWTVHPRPYWINCTEEFVEAWLERDPRGPRMRVPSKELQLIAAE